MSSQLCDPVIKVKTARDSRTKPCGINQEDKVGLGQFGQHVKNDEHLKKRRGFANQTRLHSNTTESVVNQYQTQHQQDISAENKGCQPDGNFGEIRAIVQTQQDKPCHQKHFVGKRIQNFAKLTDLIVPSGNESIHRIAESRQRKNGERKPAKPFTSSVHIVKKRHDEGRNHQDPQNRYLVGKRHFNREATSGGDLLGDDNEGAARFLHRSYRGS